MNIRKPLAFLIFMVVSLFVCRLSPMIVNAHERRFGE